MAFPSYDPQDDEVTGTRPVPLAGVTVADRVATMKAVRAAGPAGLLIGWGHGEVLPTTANAAVKAGLGVIVDGGNGTRWIIASEFVSL